MIARPIVALVLLIAFAACYAGTSRAKAEDTADSVTSNVYNNDMDGVTAHFDDALKKDVSRGDLGTLSDKMHELGAYKKLSFVASDAAKNEYTYRADFDRGSMNVVVRVDADGKLSAYRVFTNT